MTMQAVSGIVADMDPTPEKLMARARALLPPIAARRDAADRLRDLPPETVAEIRDAGLFRAFQPATWGGLQLDPRALLDLQNVFAAVCPSTAWVYGVLSVQAFMLARFHQNAQADVWGQNPNALVSSSFTPVGKVTPVDGGFRLSGRFTFSSGSSHCDWAVVGGIVPSGVGREVPEMRLFLVPRADYAIEDVWHTIGLRGTGSNDLVIDDVFVPAYRTYNPDGGILPLPKSSGLAPLYRLPWLYVFGSTISNLGIGAGRGALAAFTEVTRTRTGVANQPSRENPAFLSAMARAHVEIDMIELVVKRNYAAMIDWVERDAPMPVAEALLYRTQMTGSMRRIAALVDELMLLLGGRGIRTDSPVTRFWLDLSTARNHPGNDPAAANGLLAGEMLAGRC
jgi:3-hydroxy-9,10-secoandrosta-1,3,5(10)-triene-9,17-dione monooxygenase